MVQEEVVMVKRLDALRTRHRELDDKIDALAIDAVASEFELRRLKKEKLGIRDQIAQIEEVLYPDIIA